ncbi:hypothetical protein IPA_06710 [Ignicoccus pacificus DSM 13166]|uniref:Endonuclease GajA/Old nuclease/RecF-like AAA domain-containing protein n=1 Tax=Ignicoccus pacificus DSM 13166 TaxID=940294 RepID=A0A977KBK3_9CREN|nr:hypothetical protein IPA_06710 [Ignicoccus pacificus DSM 13166]
MSTILKIDRFGPIENLELEISRGTYVTIGLPNKGKSYLMKLLFLITRLHQSPVLGGPEDPEGAFKFMFKELYGEEGVKLFNASKFEIYGYLYNLTFEEGRVEIEEKEVDLVPSSCEAGSRTEVNLTEASLDVLSTSNLIAVMPPRNEKERLALLVGGLIVGTSYCEVEMTVPIFTGRGFSRMKEKVDVALLPFSVFLPHGRSFVIEHYSLSQEYPMEFSGYLKLYQSMRYRLTVYPWLKALELNKDRLSETQIVNKVMKEVTGGYVEVKNGKLLFKGVNSTVMVHSSADAVKELVALASSEILASSNPFSYLFIEEPENQLHPRAQAILAKTLPNIAEVLMFTTHSPFMIIGSCLNSKRRVRFVYLGKEATVLSCKEIMNEIPEITEVSLEQLEEVDKNWNIITSKEN